MLQEITNTEKPRNRSSPVLVKRLRSRNILAPQDDNSLASDEWSHDRFEILETLGCGGQSRVVKARDRTDGSIYAIKMIPYNCNRKYADRELCIHRSLNPDKCFHIVKLFGHYFHRKDKNHHYLCLVLEYCSHSLLDMVKESGQLSEDLAVNYTLQLTSAMEFLLENQIIHRDIKLANILIGQDGRLKVADFGISTNTGDRRKTIVGTEGYMAPEMEGNKDTSEAGKLALAQAKDKLSIALQMDEDLFDSQYDEKVDLWSLGTVLYGMVTGNLPDGDTEYNSALDFCFDESSSFDFDFPDFVSFEAMDLILSLLEDEPNERISLVDIVSHPWIQQRVPFD